MSLDFSVISRMIVDSLFTDGKEKGKKESFDEQTTNADSYIGNTERNVLIGLTWIISLILSIVAFWLSWTCNTAMGYNLALKALFGAGAFFFGLTYIVLYFIMRWDVCSGIVKMKRV